METNRRLPSHPREPLFIGTRIFCRIIFGNMSSWALTKGSVVSKAPSLLSGCGRRLSGYCYAILLRSPRRKRPFNSTRWAEGGGSEGAKNLRILFPRSPQKKKNRPEFIRTHKETFVQSPLSLYRWEISAPHIALGMYAAKGKKEAGAISFSSGGRGRGVATTEKGDQRGGGIRRRLSPVRPLREGSGPSCFLLALLPPPPFSQMA